MTIHPLLDAWYSTKASPQQQAVIDWVVEGTGSAAVQAVAGAGKTTTLIHALMATQGTVAFCAFNKKIAEEIKAKVAKIEGLGNRVKVGTFHSFGFQAWKRVYPRVKMDGRLQADKTREHLATKFTAAEITTLESLARKLVSLAKNRLIGLNSQIDDARAWYDIVDHFDLAYEIEDQDMTHQAIAMAQTVLRFQIELAREVIDFDDMIYMPVVSGIQMYTNDWILVDEYQDTNEARRGLARKMLAPGGRALFVGDDNQAIYGFTGADADATARIRRDFDCVELPLTITYRCPKAVVNFARKYVSHIEAHESAPEGVVRSIDPADLIKENLTAADAILCRLTKPLVETAYSLIRAGVACHVEGRDIGQGLIKLISRYKVRSIAELTTRLEDYRDREVEKLVAKGKETAAEALKDRVETIFVLAQNTPSIDALKARINEMFVDSNSEPRPTLTLSTVHKAKGREWKRVYILGFNQYMPSPWARQDWQKQQETNLIYVAATRAQEELITVP